VLLDRFYVVDEVPMDPRHHSKVEYARCARGSRSRRVRPGFARRWGRFVRERFPLLQNLPMVAAFFAANVAVGSRAAASVPALPRLILAGAVLVSFFLRLRIFDDVKDQSTDVASNPGRPLARGLIGPGEARAVVRLLALEACSRPPSAGPRSCLAGGRRFLAARFKEFFCGPGRPGWAMRHTHVRRR
jgi:4-hydroxybenzoate polyprenyltransferase